MLFDASRFLADEFQPRTAEIEIPALQSYFGEAEPVFTVRGLTMLELSKAEEAATKGQKTLAESLTVFEEAKVLENIQDLKTSLGLGKKTPVAYAMMLEQVKMAVVSPELSLQALVKLSVVKPAEFKMMFLKVMELTGLGQEAKKKPVDYGSAQTSGLQ